jgi:hypothetical protein
MDDIEISQTTLSACLYIPKTDISRIIILPIVLYGCETLSILKSTHRLVSRDGGDMFL